MAHSPDKTIATKAERDAGDDNKPGMQGTQDNLAQEQAAAQDNSQSIAYEKDTSRTAALRK